MGLIRSRQRVADHGEVFTPEWLVNDMLDLVKGESERIDSRFLEPACGSGNFLVKVLERKLGTVQSRYRKSPFERRCFALLALMSIYGIELLADNAAECRSNLLAIYVKFLKDADETWHLAGEKVLALNIVQGNALTLENAEGEPIVFAEWGYLGKGKFQRRDFQYAKLTQRSSYGEVGDLLSEASDIFTPLTSYMPKTVEEIAA